MDTGSRPSAARLEDSTRLSGEEVSGEKTTMVVKAPAAAVAPATRKCSLCGCEDVVTNTGQTDEVGREKIHHLVTIELKYIRRPEDLTAYLRSRGWKYRQHQGRHAMERFVCRPCLINRGTMERDWTKKCAGDQASKKETHYQALCD